MAARMAVGRGGEKELRVETLGQSLRCDPVRETLHAFTGEPQIFFFQQIGKIDFVAVQRAAIRFKRQQPFRRNEIPGVRFARKQDTRFFEGFADRKSVV